MVCLWCSLPLLTLAHAQLGPGENPLPKIAKEGEQDFNQMAAANVNNVARLYFASLGVFDYFLCTLMLQRYEIQHGTSMGNCIQVLQFLQAMP